MSASFVSFQSKADGRITGPGVGTSRRHESPLVLLLQEVQLQLIVLKGCEAATNTLNGVGTAGALHRTWGWNSHTHLIIEGIDKRPVRGPKLRLEEKCSRPTRAQSLV